MTAEVQKSAILIGSFRYRLERRWGPGRAFVVIGCNPSTADAFEDDPTIRRCIGFAKTHGCDALVMVNVFGFRATDVRELRTRAAIDARGPENTAHLYDACRLPDAIVVCAWGSVAKLPAHLRDEPRRVAAYVRAVSARPLHVLRLNKNGDPEHPLYLPGDLRAEVWRG